MKCYLVCCLCLIAIIKAQTSPVADLATQNITLASLVLNLTIGDTTVVLPMADLTIQNTTVMSPAVNLTIENTTLIPPMADLTIQNITSMSPVVNFTTENTTVMSPAVNLTIENTTLIPPMADLTIQNITLMSPVVSLTTENTTVVPPMADLTTESITLVSPVVDLTTQSIISASPVENLTIQNTSLVMISQEACTTSGGYDQCVPIKKCPKLLRLLQESPSKNAEILKKSQCGFEGRDPKVCCKAKSNNTDMIEVGGISELNDTHILGSERPCRTPDQRQGQCMSIWRCPSLVDLLLERPLPSRNVEYLKNSRCGHSERGPRVCCRIDKGIDAELDTRGPSTEPVTADILPNGVLCGVSFSERLSITGTADVDEFPWMAILEYQTPNGSVFNCGGVLINQKYVLTAAHCLQGKTIPEDWKLTSARFGDHDTGKYSECIPLDFEEFCADPPVDVPVEKQIIHEEYNPDDNNHLHDIALIKLAKEVKFTEFIRPICVPTPETPLRSGHTKLVGYWSKNVGTESQIMRKVEVEELPNTNCLGVFESNTVNITANHLCVEEVGSGQSCTRVSDGSPFVQPVVLSGLHWYVVGIQSFEPAECGMKPNIYTRVSQYLPWIEGNIKL